MPVTTNTRKLAALLGASGAGIGTDGLMQSAGIDTDMATQAELDAVSTTVTANETDADKIQSNLAILAIRQAADHNDVKYNLQDRIIDDYYDASGIDASPSTNHTLTAGVYEGGTSVTPTVTFPGTASTGTSAGGYSWYKWTTATSQTISTNTAQDWQYIVVGGGAGAGQASGGGGGGAGGFRTGTLALSASTNYTVTVGAGGGGATGSTDHGDNGGSSVFSSITSTGGGGGGSENSSYDHGLVGASGGGGARRNEGTGGASNTAYGNDGGDAFDGSGGYWGGGGGGAGAVGTDAVVTQGGPGGVGEDEVMGMNAADSYTFLTSASAGEVVSGARYFAGGGGGGSGASGNLGAGGSGGGGDGGKQSNTAATDGTDSTGGGGGASYDNVSGASPARAGNGGSGIVILRALTVMDNVLNLTLQSTDTEAEAQPTKADMVMLVEDAGTGVGTENTHIKGHISRDSGTTFTEGILVDEGDWGTNKRILAFHDLDISGQPADQTMCYKITTHSASLVYNTKIHATSIGWK